MSCCNGNDNSCSAPCIAERTDNCRNKCHERFAPTSTTFEQSFSKNGGCVLEFDGVDDYFKLDGTVADMIPASTMDVGWSIEAWIRFDKAGNTEQHASGSQVFGTTCNFNNVYIKDSVLQYYRWPHITGLTTTALVDGRFHHIAAVTENGRGGCTGDLGGQCRAGPNVVRLFVDGVMEATVSLMDLPGSVMQQNWFYFGCSTGGCIHEGATNPTLHNFAAVTLHSMRTSSAVRYTVDFAPPPVLVKDASTTILFNVNEGSGNTLHDEGNVGMTATIEGATWSCRTTTTATATTTTTTTSSTTGTAPKSTASRSNDAVDGKTSVDADGSLDEEAGESPSNSDVGADSTASTPNPSSAGTAVGIVLPLVLVVAGIVAYVVLRKRERARQRTLTRGRGGRHGHHNRDEQVHTNHQYDHDHDHDSGNDSDADTTGVDPNDASRGIGGTVYSNHEVDALQQNNRGQPTVTVPQRPMPRNDPPPTVATIADYAVPEENGQTYQVPLESGGVIYAVYAGSGESGGGALYSEPVATVAVQAPAETGYSTVQLGTQAMYIAGMHDGDYEAVSTHAIPRDGYASLGAGQANTYDSSA